MSDSRKKLQAIDSCRVPGERSWSSHLRRVVIAAAALLVVLASGLSLSAISQGLEGVEQLDVISVTAARIVPQPRPLPMPLPDLSTAPALVPEALDLRTLPGRSLSNPIQSPRTLEDDTARMRGHQTRVRYLDAARPTYPRRAREMGWHGTVVLRLDVTADGTVAAAAVHRTSGYGALDQAALSAAKAWVFAPQKDGAFAMPAIVDVPVRFDLTDQRENEP
jgi:TonB family protein